MMKRLSVLAIVVLAVALIGLAVANPTQAGDTPYTAQEYGPYGNECNFQDYWTAAALSFYIQSCSQGFNF